MVVKMRKIGEKVMAKERMDKDLRAAMELMAIHNGEMSREMSMEQKRVPWIDRPYPVSSTGRRQQQAQRDGCEDGSGWPVFPKEN